MAASCSAAGTEGTVLDYQVRVRMRDASTPLESRLQLVTTPPVATHSRVKRPRFVGWYLRTVPGKGVRLPAKVLTRVQSLLYLEGPTAGIIPREGGARLGGRFCRLWQVQTPASLGAFVYLAEVAPDLLALSYLSASLPDGDIATLEIHLDGLVLARAPAPAEEGMALLHTLRTWGDLVEQDSQVMETEVIQ